METGGGVAGLSHADIDNSVDPGTAGRPLPYRDLGVSQANRIWKLVDTRIIACPIRA